MKCFNQHNSPDKQSKDTWTGDCGRYILLASEIILGTLGLVVEVTSVLNGDGIPFLGPIRAIALGEDLPSDTHDANEAG